MVTRLPEYQAVVEFLAKEAKWPNWSQMSEEEYVETALRFASASTEQALKLSFTELMYGTRLWEPAGSSGSADSVHWPVPLREAQESFARNLEIVRTDSKRARVLLAQGIKQAGERMLMRPVYVITAEGTNTKLRHYPADVDAALAFALLVILDSQKPYGGDLCRCKLQECRRFFLTIRPATGRPRRDYCSQQHLDEARAATGSQRVKKFRESQKKARKPK